jgi:hypothetical protein
MKLSVLARRYLGQRSSLQTFRRKIMRNLGLLIFIVAIAVSLTVVSFVGGKSIVPSLPSMPKIFVRIHGSGDMKSEKREVAPFKKIDAGGACEIEIVVGGAQTLEVETDDNLLELTKTYVKNDTLYVEREGNIRTKSPLRLRITMPSFEGIDLSGASRANISNVRNERVSIELSGASKIKIAGEANSLDVDLSGASSLDAENLRAVRADVEASGASKAVVFAVETLTADASGASRITYAGNPQTINKDASGASKISAK